MDSLPAAAPGASLGGAAGHPSSGSGIAAFAAVGVLSSSLIVIAPFVQDRPRARGRASLAQARLNSIRRRNQRSSARTARQIARATVEAGDRSLNAAAMAYSARGEKRGSLTIAYTGSHSSG